MALSQSPVPDLALAAAALAEAVGGNAGPGSSTSATTARRADPFTDLGAWRLGGE
jgi:hypothetical protein